MRTIFITGTSSGMGRSTAKLFSQKGWNVIATMRTPEKETELTKLKNVFVTKLDVEEKATIEKAIAAGIEKFGKIDVLVNNAGYGVSGIFEAASEEQMHRQFEVNVFGLMNVTKAMLPHFRNNKNGLIINVSSMGGKLTVPALALYHASKFAVEGFTEALVYELASMNIRLKLIEPGYIKTNFSGSSMDFSDDRSLTDYKAFSDSVKSAKQKMAAASGRGGTPEMVAEVIYGAATDDSEQLRYPAGEDAISYERLKRESGDAAYLQFVFQTYSLPKGM
jgi:NAD(P)-dependent dehydrogenase (short-subunit alcohol dehydrogenase family)